MTGRESSAVMAQRKLTKASLDMFPTPPWATRALVEEVLIPDPELELGQTVWEPACGKGHMAIPLLEYWKTVHATDVHYWGYGEHPPLDFTFADDDQFGDVDWVISNPPFKAAELFLDKGLKVARVGVALLLRLQFIEGQGRFDRVFGTDRRPAIVAPFSERVAMIEDVWDPQASSATAYAWFIWTKTPVSRSAICPIRPGCELRYHRLSDRRLATPGEARRRRAARKADRAEIQASLV